MLSVVIASRTNVDLVLRHPVPVPRPHAEDVVVDEIRFFADDPRALAASVRSLRGG